MNHLAISFPNVMRILNYKSGILFLWFMLIVVLPQFVFSQSNLQTPQMDSISITPDGNPIIKWFPNTDNTKGYAIQRLRLDNTWFPIDTVWGIGTVTYVDLGLLANPCSRFLTYNIFAVAPGEQPYVSSWSVDLKTIFLNQPQQNICANTISLNWTDYINMKEELAGYEVLASVDGINFQVLSTTQPNVTSYVHTNPLPDELYSYKIRAVNQDGTRTSSSCVQTIQSRTYPKPQFANIITASVEDNSFVRVSWEADPTAPILRFELERQAEGQTQFAIQQSFEDNLNYNPQKSYDDLTADFNSTSYYYRVVMWDSCGASPPYYSEISRIVHLSGQPRPDYTNELTWNHYEGWDTEKYNIYRNTGSGFTMIDDVPGFRNGYSDDVSAFSGLGGVFEYYVEAVEYSGNNATSKSNRIILEMETRVIVPNAFIPDGMPPDNEFKPIVSFIADGSYELLIFNKWGQMIFTTSDPNEGWTGKQDGELQPSGAYVYLIKYRTPEGQNMEKRGTVSIIR